MTFDLEDKCQGQRSFFHRILHSRLSRCRRWNKLSIWLCFRVICVWRCQTTKFQMAAKTQTWPIGIKTTSRIPSHMLVISVKFRRDWTKSVGGDTIFMPFFPYIQDQIFQNSKWRQNAGKWRIAIKSTTPMRVPLGMISTKFEPNPIKTVGRVPVWKKVYLTNK